MVTFEKKNRKIAVSLVTQPNEELQVHRLRARTMCQDAMTQRCGDGEAEQEPSKVLPTSDAYPTHEHYCTSRHWWPADRYLSVSDGLRL